MKSLVIIATFVVGLFTVVSSLQAAPRMTLPETSFNFGYVPQNSTISHVFWVHSSGDDTLKILKVSPG